MLNINPYRLLGWGAITALLLLPWVVMQLDSIDGNGPQSGVHWTLGDFIVAGILLGGTGLLIEVAVRLTRNIAYRAGFIMAVITSLLLIWINLAVGIIGSEDNPANGMYLVVLAITPVGAFFVRWRARGLRNLLIVTALAQVSVGIISLATGLTLHLPSALFLNVAFAILWLIAAGLFHNAVDAHNGTNTTT